MNEIKQRLEEKYLKMEDYYNISFDVLKKIFKQNKMPIIIFILIFKLNMHPLLNILYTSNSFFQVIYK